MATTSKAALKVMIKYEVGGGEKYYNKYLSHPSWPEGSSGVTIGCGYDLGYETENFVADWQDHLNADVIERLKKVLGKTGSRAQAAVSGVRDITIPWASAMDVFLARDIPKYEAQTRKCFPNVDALPDDAFGALVSIVFNRGPLIDNSDRRREMKNIKNILALGGDEEVDADDIRAIAKEVRSMARLWPDNKSSDGDLHDRRLEEAALIENSISS